MIPQLGSTYRYDVPLHGPQTVTVLAIHHDVWPTAYTVQWSDPSGHPITLKTDDITRFSPAPAPAMSRLEEMEAENARLKDEVARLQNELPEKVIGAIDAARKIIDQIGWENYQHSAYISIYRVLCDFYPETKRGEIFDGHDDKRNPR